MATLPVPPLESGTSTADRDRLRGFDLAIHECASTLINTVTPSAVTHQALLLTEGFSCWANPLGNNVKLYQHNTRLQHTYQRLICCCRTQHKCQQPTKAPISYHMHTILRCTALLRSPFSLATFRTLASPARSLQTSIHSAQGSYMSLCRPQCRVDCCLFSIGSADAQLLRADDRRHGYVPPKGRCRPRADRGGSQRGGRRRAARPSRARQAPNTLAHTGIHGQQYLSSGRQSCIGPCAAMVLIDLH